MIRTLLSLVDFMLRKSRAAIDRPLSRLELLGIDLVQGESLTYRERQIVRNFSWMLNGRSTCVYDIGANSGLYTSAFSKLSNVSKVVAFEPLPDEFDQLRRRFAINPRVECINEALGESVGDVEFFRNSFGASSSMLELDPEHMKLFPQASHTMKIKVEINTLDRAMEGRNLPPPTILKIDVQGYEYQVLNGATTALATAKYCVIEISLQSLYHGSPTFDTVNALMIERGFAFAGTIGELRVSWDQRPLQVDCVWERKNC